MPKKKTHPMKGEAKKHGKKHEAMEGKMFEKKEKKTPKYKKGM
jgi:hypothetical protein